MAAVLDAVVGLRRLARAIERQHQERHLRGVLSGIASALLVLSLVLLALANAVAEERVGREESLQPIEASETQARLHVGNDSSVSVANQQVTVVVVVPASDDAPPPPGVRRWPAPGMVVASPQLLAVMDADGGRGQFGDVDGTIGDDGLVDPSELRLYVRPFADAVDLDDLTPSVGWLGDGVRVPLDSISLLNASRLADISILVLSSLGFGALVALFLARRVGGRQQLESETSLSLAGASAGQLAVLRVMSAGRYLMAGAVGAAGVVALLCTVQFSLPWLSFVSDPAAYRARPVGVALAVGAGVLLSVLVAGAPSLTRPRRMRGRTAAREEQPTRWVWAFSIGAGLAILGPVIADAALVRVLCYLVGVGLVMLGLPAVIARLTATIGRAVADRSARTGSAGGIVAGRYLQRRPRSVARVAAPACLALLFVGQAHLWTGQLSAQYLDGEQVQARVGGSVLTATIGAPPDGLARFLGALPDGVGHLWVSTIPPGDPPGSPGQTRVGGTCANLQILRLPCPTAGPAPLGDISVQRTADLISGTAGSEVVVVERVTTSPAAQDPPPQLVIFSADGTKLPHGELQRLGFATVQGGLDLEPLGASWVGGGHVPYVRAGWVSFYGAIAAAVLLLVSAGGLAAEARSRAERLAGIAATFGSTRWRLTYVALDVALPVVLSAALGAASYLLLPLGFQYESGVLRPSPVLAVVALTVSVVVAVVLAGLTAHHIRSDARDWRPGAVT
ncbi:MAG: hypothetical protein ACRCYX_04160 [Dermatophilaceae bacterium]